MDKHRTYTSVKLNKVLKERAPTLEIMVVLVQCGQVADPLHARLLPSWLAGLLHEAACFTHHSLPTVTLLPRGTQQRSGYGSFIYKAHL